MKSQISSFCRAVSDGVTQFVALDWGTSSLRAYLLSASGAILDVRGNDWGIMGLPGSGDDAASRSARFAQAFWQIAGDWLAQPNTSRHVVACGMVGSAQGWREAAYIPLPATTDGLAGAMVSVDAGNGVQVHIAPGLIEHGELPNVMRGEETQIAGVLSHLEHAGLGTSGRWLIGLPGTHSKWVRVEDGVIVHFDTFMTGEVFALLSRHSVLGRSMAEQGLEASDPAARQAFDRGIRNAASQHGDRGLLSTIFSSRTLGLTNVLSGAEQIDYLSGLLIGHEIRGLLAGLPEEWRTARVAVVGREHLCQRYRQAMIVNDLDAISVDEDATVRGLWALISAQAEQAD